ncbi:MULTISPECIES: hypothetical protein [Dictyoglomus]|uniref:hypothetical protein n=1 Tax=Dictyoglomus TaxID=13 RepID=UPI0001827C1F|nr:MULTISPECIES: hypothetical protein [Dictyoglomus]
MVWVGLVVVFVLNSESFYDWYYKFEKVKNIIKEDAEKIVFVDGLGVEFLSLLQAILKEKVFDTKENKKSAEVGKEQSPKKSSREIGKLKVRRKSEELFKDWANDVLTKYHFEEISKYPSQKISWLWT